MTQGVQAAFFSYCREDSDFALRLAGDLKTAGASVWLDQLDIVPGQRWDHAVQDALASCQRMLVILTPAAVNSTNVMDEVSFALEEGKTVIPVIYKDCAVPFRLRRLQHIDFRTDYARGLKLLLKVLGVEQQVLGPESMPKVSVAPQIVDSATTEKPAGKGEAQVDPNRLGALLHQAEAGNTGAMSELGYMCGTGKGVAEDQQQSFLWYRKAAEAGDVNGMFNVALIYHADGPEKDEGRAVFWYRKAAEAGDRHAMSKLAYMYEHGLGVERDYSQALTWYGKAHEREYGPEVEQTADSLRRVSFLQEESQKALKQQQREKHARAEDTDRIQFVSIAIHHRSDKYWREGECSEHRSKISNKAAQYFHMTVFDSDSDFWKEHRDPVNADPLFDITVKNESGRSLIFRKVGIVISVVANSNYLWGIPTAVRIPVSANYAVDVPNLRERFQDAYDGFELKPKRLDEVVWVRVPHPYALEPEAPFRYTLRLKNYCENMPNHARLQMWCDTDHGEFRSGEIALLRY